MRVSRVFRDLAPLEIALWDRDILSSDLVSATRLRAGAMLRYPSQPWPGTCVGMFPQFIGNCVVIEPMPVLSFKNAHGIGNWPFSKFQPPGGTGLAGSPWGVGRNQRG